MIETISPAVCGTRRRTMLALLFFAAGALVAAVGMGIALARIRGIVPDAALVPVALVAAVIVLRTRRQVPERWHRERPLAIWASGYGAGLGAGVLTYQPSLAFVCVALAVVALHSVPLGVLAFAAFAAGRIAAAALPPVAIDVLPRLHAPMRRLGFAAVAVLALAVAAAPAHAAATGRSDPAAAADGTMAFTQRAADGTTSVVVVPGDGSALHAFPGGSYPALDGPRLAFADATGIAIVTWADGATLAHLDGPYTKPALAWPTMIAIRTTGGSKVLVAHDMQTGAEHILERASTATDLGRPSTDGQNIVWHLTTTHVSRLRIAHLGVFATHTLLLTRVKLLANPAVHGSRFVYVVQRRGHSLLTVQRIGARRGRGLLLTKSPRVMWTTATDGPRAYVTIWNTDTGVAGIRRVAL
jgi:hypothetical protein